MTIQLSTTVRNAKLDAIESTIGLTPILKVWSGALPANCAASNAGTALAVLTLPSDWMNPASSGSKTKLGTWEDSVADNSGTAVHFRLYDSGGTTCHLQGSITVTGGGGDMTIDNTTINAGQDIVVTGFSLTEGNS